MVTTITVDFVDAIVLVVLVLRSHFTLYELRSNVYTAIKFEIRILEITVTASFELYMPISK